MFITQTASPIIVLCELQARNWGRNVFQGQMPQGCQKYHQTYETKAIIHWITTPWYCSIKRVGQWRNGMSCWERSISVKTNMCQKLSGTAFMVHTLRMVIKYATQVRTGMKIQHLPRQKSQNGNNRNRNLLILSEKCCLYTFRDRMECQSCAVSLPNGAKILSPPLGSV
jgi:hypothetical protein